MEDSGIDSEDKQSTLYDDIQMIPQRSSKSTNVEVPATKQHMADLDVVFRGASNANGATNGLLDAHKAAVVASNSNGERKASDSDYDDNSGGVIRTQPAAAPNTCRILQRKLELKVERAKRNYTQYQEDHAKKSQSANLIPINRLPIPGDLEQKPLVDYKSDSSDEPEEISFFPAKLKHARKHQKTELSDTFSIQEMTIDSDLDSDDSGGSQNLELLPPMMKRNVLDKFKSCFNCSYGS